MTFSKPAATRPSARLLFRLQQAATDAGAAAIQVLGAAEYLLRQSNERPDQSPPCRRQGDVNRRHAGALAS